MKWLAEVEDRAQGGSSPLGRNLPTGTSNKLPAKQGTAQWKTSKSGQASPLAARRANLWGSHSSAKAESVHPEEHEMGDILSMGLMKVHQLARVILFSKTGDQCAKAKRHDLNCVSRMISERRSASYQPDSLWQCESCIHTVKCGWARIVAAGT